jgi:hypothetical protein
MWLGISEGIRTRLAIATHATALADNTERMFVQLPKPGQRVLNSSMLAHAFSNITAMALTAKNNVGFAARIETLCPPPQNFSVADSDTRRASPTATLRLLTADG